MNLGIALRLGMKSLAHSGKFPSWHEVERSRRRSSSLGMQRLWARQGMGAFSCWKEAWNWKWSGVGNLRGLILFLNLDRGANDE